MRSICKIVERYQRNERIEEKNLSNCTQLFVDFCINGEPRLTRTPEGDLVWVGPKDMSMFTNFFEKQLLETIVSGFDALVSEWRSAYTVSEYMRKVRGLISGAENDEDNFDTKKLRITETSSVNLRTDYSQAEFLTRGGTSARV